MYDASKTPATDPELCAAAIGRRFTLPLTGEVVDWNDGEGGCYVKFQVDDRWGFTQGDRTFIVGCDLEALVPNDPIMPMMGASS